MLVFWKERLVILAVPKTGTTALAGALAPRAAVVLRDPPPVKHATLRRWRRAVAPLFPPVGDRPFETLAVVREPVGWLSSWYRYRTREGLAGQPNSTRGISFDAFVEEYCREAPAPFAAVGSQAAYVFDADGQRGVTHLFRHGEPGPLLDFLEERLGTRPELQRLNVSPEVPVELSAPVLERLRRERPREFAAWEAAG